MKWNKCTLCQHPFISDESINHAVGDVPYVSWKKNESQALARTPFVT